MTNRASYQTFVIERPVAAPRDLVWHALLELLTTTGYVADGDPPPHGPGATLAFGLGDHDLVEQTLSFEPPWRRCYAIVAGAPVALYQGTTTIRDDGPTCLLVWSYVADPGDHDGAAAFLERAQLALHTATEHVAAVAEARAAAST